MKKFWNDIFDFMHHTLKKYITIKQIYNINIEKQTSFCLLHDESNSFSSSLSDSDMGAEADWLSQLVSDDIV